MKHSLIAVLACTAACGAFAQETGKVLSSAPVIQQVAVQRQVCTSQSVATPPQTSGVGGLLGAIAGAAIGSSIGGGDGRIAATMLGTVGGAMLGNSIEGQGAAGVQQGQNCAPQTSYENRTVGYDVTYEYAGKQYTARMPNDPGPTVRLQVTPVGADTRPPAQGTPLVTAPPVAQAAPGVIPAEPLHTVVYPSYSYVRPYYPSYSWYPPISFNFGYVYHKHRGYHRRHWR